MKIPAHSIKFIVLTGGPGAGKTAVMEVARQLFCDHVSILPESASIVYAGGFPRRNSDVGVRAAQKAIARVQMELEDLVIDEAAIALCDRGIMDGAAYWPNGELSFYDAVGLSAAQIAARYHTVIHLRTPTIERGYNHSNPMRIESPEQAYLLDQKIERAWAAHPNRIIVDSTETFTDKIEQVMEIIRQGLWDCCEHARDVRRPAKVTIPQRSLLQ